MNHDAAGTPDRRRDNLLMVEESHGRSYIKGGGAMEPSFKRRLEGARPDRRCNGGHSWIPYRWRRCQ